jgi:hypothetical protein
MMTTTMMMIKSKSTSGLRSTSPTAEGVSMVWTNIRQGPTTTFHDWHSFFWLLLFVFSSDFIVTIDAWQYHHYHYHSPFSSPPQPQQQQQQQPPRSTLSPSSLVMGLTRSTAFQHEQHHHLYHRRTRNLTPTTMLRAKSSSKDDGDHDDDAVVVPVGETKVNDHSIQSTSSSSSSTSSSSSSSSYKQMMRWVFDDNDNEVDDVDFDDLFDDDDDDYDDNVDNYYNNDYDYDYDSSENEDDNVGPNVVLNDDDLSMLHNITIYNPKQSTTTTTLIKRSNDNNSLRSSTQRRSTRTGTESSTNNSKSNNMNLSHDQEDESSSSSTILLPPLVDVISSSTDLSYFYLRDGLGLSEDVMWKITTEAPSVLGFKAGNIREKVHVLKSTVDVTEEEIRFLITAQPTILQLSAKKNVAPTILFLQRQLDLGKKDLKTLILGCPALLKYSIGNLNNKIVFFQETMGYTITECRNLLLSHPRLLTCSVETGLVPRWTFLHREVEISIPDIRTIIQKNPLILKMSVNENLQPKLIYYCIMTLRMTPDQVGKLLLKYPQIMDYNLDNHIRPIHDYFISLDFSTQEFARIIQRFPRIITLSLSRIKQRIGYLRFELYLDPNSIRRIIHQNPQLMSLTQRNIRSTIDYLLDVITPGATLYSENNDNVNIRIRNDNDNDYTNDNNNNHVVRKDDLDDDTGNVDELTGNNDNININHPNAQDTVSIDDSTLSSLYIVQTLITGSPSLLNFDFNKTLQPKVEYLRRTLGQNGLSIALLKMPALLSYSLNKRIVPRIESMIDAGIDCTKITYVIPKTDDDFHLWLAKSIAIHDKKKKKKTNQVDVVNDTIAGTVTGSDVESTDSTIVAMRPSQTLADNRISGTMTPSTTRVGEVVKNLNIIQEDSLNQEEDDNKDNGGRVVEEGGRIIHWRRPSR